MARPRFIVSSFQAISLSREIGTLDMAKCEVCGKPMPTGEEMFRIHGYSGPCPAPPLPKPTLMGEVLKVLNEGDVKFWHKERIAEAIIDLFKRINLNEAE